MTRWVPLALLMVAGCGEPVESGKPAKAAAAKPARARETADLTAQADAAYFYNPAGKRDPFQGFLTRQKSPGADISPDAPPLQRWEAEKFVLSGVIWDIDAPRALLVDPEGTGHVIRMGTYVGRNWGKVTSIADDGVVVTEEYQTLTGELVVNPVSIRFAGSSK